MSIEELFKDKSLIEVVKALEKTENELKTLINPIRGVISPEQKNENDLFERVKGLRLEVEEMVKEIESSKNKRDLHLIKKITEKVKKIVQDKHEIQEELRMMRLN